MRSLQSYLLWALLSLFGLIRGPRPPLEQTRKTMERRSKLLPLPAGTAIRGVQVEGLPAEWVIPPGSSTRGVMLYLHGGAFSMGSRRTHRAFVARLAAASHLRALSLDYRLAPEHPFPAGLEDVLTAYRWLLQQGTPAERLVIAGDSAGGNLALAALLSLTGETGLGAGGTRW